MMRLTYILFLFFAYPSFGQTFEEILKMAPADRDEEDRFGYAVSIDGNYAAVGAYGDDEGPVDPNWGSVYIYEQQGQNNWVQIQKLQSSDINDYDRFGWSVDIKGDFLIVGAYGEDHDENGNNNLSKAGSAYIFQNINGTWTEMQKIVASDREADDEFGWSVAIYDSTAMVGAHIEDHDEFGGDFKYHSGSVYAFELNTGGVWVETQKIVADDRWVDMNFPNGYSGEDLADQFGGSVALWDDWMIVGAHHHDYATTSPLSGAMWSSGAAYIFERSGGVWNQVQKIQNFDREPWDRFGYDVAIDSNIIAVCAYSEDEEEDGVSNPLTNPGSVYIFQRDGGGSWNPAQKIVPNDRSSGDHFGYSIDIDDTLMVLGCHSDDHDKFGGDLKTDAGSAYVFTKSGGSWSQHQKIDASDRVEGDDFGVSVGISGHTILVGAQYQDFNSTQADSLEDAGAAYFYTKELCPIITKNDTINLCDGNVYNIGTSTYSTGGDFTDVLTAVSGCDSTIYTHIDLLTGVTTDVFASMCNGGVYYIFGTPVTVPGNYSYDLVAENGCDSTVITHLTMDPAITSEQYINICLGDSYSIGTSTYTTSGTYQDVVSAANFCDSTITTHLSVDLPPNLAVSQNISALTSNESNANAYQWIDCATNQPIAGENNQTFFATQVGSYKVAVTKGSCTDTSACVYISWIVASNEQYKLEQQLEVYPNPTFGDLTIETGNWESTLQATLFNPLGQAIENFEIKGKTALNLDYLSSGTYLLEIKSGDAVIRKRIILK